MVGVAALLPLLALAAFAAAERGSETLELDFMTYTAVDYFGFEVVSVALRQPLLAISPSVRGLSVR